MIDYCKECSVRILSQWQGWPLKKPVPLLPHIEDGVCLACGNRGDILANTDIQWLNYHGPYNTGLPDYWLLVTDRKTFWGLPFHSETTCHRCGGRAVISEHGDSRRGRGAFAYKATCSSCYAEKVRQAEEARIRESLRRQEEEQRQQFERYEYFRKIAGLPFLDRLTAIANDRSINVARNFREWIDWAPECRRCSEEEMAGLSAESIQSLIELCEVNSFLVSRTVLQELYDRRHQFRQVAMAEIRRKYAGRSPVEQLTELAVSTSTPIAQYPVELAEHVSPDWLDCLPETKRAEFLEQLANCKLRIWIRVRKRLSLEKSDTRP